MNDEDWQYIKDYFEGYFREKETGMNLGPRELRGMELRRMELRMEFMRRGMAGVEERFMAAHMVMAHDWTVEQVLEASRCGLGVGMLHDVLKAYGMLEKGMDDGLIVTVIEDDREEDDPGDGADFFACEHERTSQEGHDPEICRRKTDEEIAGMMEELLPREGLGEDGGVS